MSVIPVFRDNQETSSILANSTISMLEEIPDTLKAFIVQGSSVLTEVGATFQMPNLNSWIQGEIELVAQRTFEFTGKTEAPLVSTSGSPPVHWNKAQSTFDAFALNKLISEIKFSIANKQFSEVDRERPEMIDIFNLQFDKDILDSYGIYGSNRGDSLEHYQNEVYGSGLQSIGAYIAGDNTDFSNRINISLGGYRNNYINDQLMQRQPWQQNTKGYVKVVSNTFTTTQPATTLVASSIVPGYIGLELPTVVGTPLIPYFSKTATTDFVLTQKVVLEIHEFIVSPNLSNPYSKNKNKKIYYSGGNPFNLQFSFNQQYAKSMFKWVGNKNIERNAGAGAAAVLTSSAWNKMEAKFWTFDTAKPLPSIPIKTIYYKQEAQTQSTFNFNALSGATTGNVTVNTSTLSSLPPYIIVYGVARPSNNTTYFAPGELGKVPYSELLDIESLNIRLGTQSDMLASMDLQKEELVKHTLEVLGSPEYRSLIQGTESHMVSFDFGQQAVLPLPAVFDTNSARQTSNNNGFPFYILDVAKLNLRDLSGMPLLPTVNYGSSSFKALSVSATFRGNGQMRTVSTATSINGEMNVILMEKRIRTLPLLSGNMTDDKVEYYIDDVSEQLYEHINDVDYSSNGNNQLQYIGGSFMGSVFDHVKQFLSNPMLKTAAKLTRALRDATADEQGLFKGVHTVSSALARGADVVGLGRKNSKYSRV